MLAKNIIYTGVAGTGKTYQLQQLAKQYTEKLPAIDLAQLTETLVEPLGWREVICLVFLQQHQIGKKLLKVNEIIHHPFFIAKSNQRIDNNSLYSTAIGYLQKYSSLTSQTVNLKNKTGQEFFDKDASGSWYLLPKAIALLPDLQQKFNDYQYAINHLQSHCIERFCFVSFHQAYGYEEFVEGIRPRLNEHGQISYHIQAGAFLALCERARQDPQHRYAFLIDELNRANVVRVFGELMSLIEPSKREGQPNALHIKLAYSGKTFSIPNNVDIYASMNTQDHSLTPLDMAFRRRFRFIECLPNYDILPILATDTTSIDLAKLLQAINQRICQYLDKDNQLGQSFLLEIKNIQQLAECFSQQIIPQLAQACGQQGDILQKILNQDFIEIKQNDQLLLANHTFQMPIELIDITGKFLYAGTYQKLYET